MNIERVLNKYRALGVSVSNVDISNELGISDADNALHMYITSLVPERNIFVSEVYLWCPANIIEAIETPDSMPSELWTHGYVPIGCSFSGEYYFVNVDVQAVYWSSGQWFLDGKIIVPKDGKHQFLEIAVDTLDLLLTYVSSFNDDFLIDLLDGRLTKLLRILDKNALL